MTGLARRWLDRWGRCRAVLVLSALVMSGPAFAEGRNIALLIGNSDYQQTSDLANPANDVALVGGALESIGFAPVKVDINLPKEKMDAALAEFAAMAKGADAAIVYFAGHGIEISGENYLVPTTTGLSDPALIQQGGVRLGEVLEAVSEARLRLIVLDACRNNPYLRHLGGDDEQAYANLGIGDIQTSGETLVVYATRAGSVAEDGGGRNSPFALAFAQRVVEPGVELRMMLARVRDDVLLATQQYQEPYIYGSLSAEPRYLAGSRPLPRSMTVAINPGEIDALYWQGAISIGTKQAYEDYLFRFPQGLFASQARTLAQASEAELAAQPMDMLSFCNETVQDRFPISQGATVDVGIANALALFSGVQGRFDLTEVRASLYPGDYAKYLALRRFIDGGLRIEVSLASLPEGYDEIELSASGTAYRWRRGEREKVPFFWTPYAAPEAHVRLYRNGELVDQITTIGPWALFRLFDKAWKRTLGENEFDAAFFSRQGSRFRVTFPGDRNPFSGSGMWSFRCLPYDHDPDAPDEFGDRG